MGKEKLPVTAAMRALREHGVAFTHHPYDYEERGGTAVSARELGVPERQVIKTLIMEDDAKRPLVVLMHGGTPKGAELIAAKWADNRKVPQVAFKPDWTKHAKAAPFKRNDAMLEVLPIGVMIFPGTGIQENLADKARKLGIPVWRFGGT